MCGPTTTTTTTVQSTTPHRNGDHPVTDKMKTLVTKHPSAPLVSREPSWIARYSCASAMMAVMVVWAKLTYVEETKTPGAFTLMHDYKLPLFFTVGYVVSLPILTSWCESCLWKTTDVKALLKETMILYNGMQVLINCWMVYRCVESVLFRGHPFIGDFRTMSSGMPLTVWVHYTDKYLEFFDTYFMVLRGRMDQVTFLHVYHHFSIVWAWWIALTMSPGGDCYFGAMLNSFIHVLMYSYYTMSLLKISCPWKKYLTQAQMLQFVAVLVYSVVSYAMLPSDITWKIQLCYVVQPFEMISLFALFVHFYLKSYSKKKKKNKSKLPKKNV